MATKTSLWLIFENVFDNTFSVFLLLYSFPFLIFFKYFPVYPFLLIILDLYELSRALALCFFSMSNYTGMDEQDPSQTSHMYVRLRNILQTFSQGYAQQHHKHLLENGYFIYVVRFWVRLRKKNKEGGCGLHSSMKWHITYYSNHNLGVENYFFFVWLSVSFNWKSLSQTLLKFFFSFLNFPLVLSSLVILLWYRIRLLTS